MPEHDSGPAPEPVTAETLDAREHGALEILQEVCRASGLDIAPEPRSRHHPYLDVELVGGDAEISFGRGPALDALQNLSNLVVSRRIGSDVRLILDVAGYRARRAANLRTLALEFADQVKQRQEECELDPLPAHERRIIHHALMDDPAIRTYSEGDDPDRRVIIAPR